MTYPLKTLDAGITFRRFFPELIPEIEERESARSNGYTWEAWLTLARPLRVAGLAYSRVRRLIEMHQQDAQEQDIKMKQKQARAKSQQARSTSGRSRGRR